jgi:tetratricopeptide (TPR) repeat protein
MTILDKHCGANAKSTMSNNNIESLRGLLRILKPAEVESLKVYLKAFNNMFGNYEPKTLKLLTQVLSRKRYSDQTIRSMVSPNVSDNTFRMLVMRLKEKVYECLTLDMNTRRAEAYSHHYKTRIEVRKRLSQAEILHARGAIEEAMYLSNKIIRLCKKYEVYDTLIQALYHKQEMLIVRSNTADFEALQQLVNHFRKCQDAQELARHHFYRLAAVEEYNAAETNAAEDYLRTLSTLQMGYRNTPSSGLRYWIYLIQLNYLESTDQFAEGVSLCKEIVVFLRREPAVFMERRLGTVCIHSAHNSLQLSNFAGCKQSAVTAQRLFEPNSFNRLLAGEYEFYAAFYTGKFSRAEALISEMIKCTDPVTSAFKHAKRHYLKACTLFQMKKFRRAHFALRDTVLLDHDKGGWNVAVRTMNIMNQIEWGGLNKPTEAFIDSLNVHFNALKKYEEIPPRAACIQQLLRKLMKNSFNFSQTLPQVEPIIALLGSARSGMQWQPGNAELIRFDTWFMEMVSQETSAVVSS